MRLAFCLLTSSLTVPNAARATSRAASVLTDTVTG